MAPYGMREYLKDLLTKEDENGNVNYVKTDENDSNTITLNYNHRPNRRAGESNKVNDIKNEASALKRQVIENLVANAEDQNQSGTVVEYASAFDLNMKHSKEKHIDYIKQLYLIYAEEYSHTIEDVAAKGDLVDYSITIRYPAKIECTEEELIGEFNFI